MSVVQLIPLATPIATTAAGVYDNQIEGISQVSLQFIVTGADAAPKVSLYGSNDGVNWDLYSALSTDVILPTNGSQSIIDVAFPHEYLSVSIDINGGTTGTIECKLNNKILTR
jgi:hypothetical protein